MFSVLTLNAKGLISHEKQISLHDYSKNTRSSLIFLQETNLDQQSTFVNPNNFHFLLNPPVQPCSGVAIAFTPALYHEAEIFSHKILVPGYLQAVHTKINQQEYHLINVYMPHLNEKASKVINQISNYLKGIKPDSVIILAGDWNLTTQQEDRKNCSEIRTQLAQDLQLLLNQNNLTDVWREFNPLKAQFTFRGYHQNHPMARLDRIYMKSEDLHLVTKTEIIPSFSDHSGVTLKLFSTTQHYKPPYWKLDSALLNSEEYQQIVKNILEYFTEKSEEMDCDITTLWDNLKEEVKLASQRFMKKIKQQAQEHLQILLAQINHIESKETLSKNDEQLLLQIEHEIYNTYKQNSKEKLKIVESQISKEANTQSKFFLRLARETKPSAAINQLEINGQLTTDRSQIFKEVHEHFKNTFSSQDLNTIDTSSPLYKDLPTISESDKESCESLITLEEIEDSIKQAQLNRAPGYDGLPIEFYKFFWDNIKNLLLKVFLNFQSTETLPKSMKKVIIAPVPKKGDRLQLNNWRPIALCNCDYKILSRIYSKKISCVLSPLLKSDQSYCVPGRTIYNNLHLIRNIIQDSNKTNSPVGILALDQSGAFNRLSHQYLTHLLKIHGFGPKLRRAISSLLSDTIGHVKIGSSLLPPFIFFIGARQGDPLAGPLYVISVEPFLRLTSKLMETGGYQIPKTILKICNTAFADDFHFFVTNDRHFPKITEAFEIYSDQSGAILNQEKSTGLFCGQWKNRTDKPLQCQWNSEGIKSLGVYFGNSTKFENKNWESLTIKITGTLNKWSQYVKLTSYYGRKIICNQLAGSQLNHVLNVLQPPNSFIHQIHKAMVNFIWQGKHWLHSNYVFAPIERGGLGLTHLEAKLQSLRLKLATNLQSNFENEDPGYQLHFYKMSSYNNTTPQHFFSQKKQYIEMANLDTFYQSVLNAWHSISPKLLTTRFSVSTLRQTPLYGSNLINEEKLTVIPDWKICGFSTLQELMEPNGKWKTLSFLHLPRSNERRLSYNLNQIKVYFNKKIKEDNENESEQMKYQFYDSTQDKPREFPAPMRTLYLTCLDNHLKKPQVNGKSMWLTQSFNWTSLYNHPIDRRDSDISWRLLHNALVTPKKLKQWNVIPSESCPWCNEVGNIMHMIFHCNQTTQLWKHIFIKVKTINGSSTSLTYEQALTGFPPTTPASKLTNFILALAKSTIYRTFMNCIKEQTPPAPNYLAIFKKRIQYRLTLEAHHAKLTGTEENFKKKFLINNALNA